MTRYSPTGWVMVLRGLMGAASVPAGEDPPADLLMALLIVATLNIQGCRMGLRRCQVLSSLREQGYSVVFLQETHTDLAAEDSWQLKCGDRVYFSHLTVRTAGVVTLFSPNLWSEVLGVAEAVPGRLLHLRARMEGLVLNLVNVYALTSGPERLQFYQQVSAFLGTLDPHECLVLGGDFNTILEEQDRLGTEQCPATADVLREIVEHHSLVDIWRDHHPDDISTFTFVRVEAHQSCHSQLDHIYLSRFHLSRAHSSSIGLALFPDHHLDTMTASFCAGPISQEWWVKFCGLRCAGGQTR
ncbi:unnamed protein product [Lepidochelys kempii]